ENPMNLICPHCQKMLSVPDQNAGQTTNCPFCGQTFQVPALPQTSGPAMLDLPTDIPLTPEPPTPEPTPPTSTQPVHEEEVYRVVPEPPKPAPAPPPPRPRREDRAQSTPSPEPPSTHQAVKTAPSPLPAG